MDIVIVESPAKAKTINKYLGNNYKVLASNGHIRDLPPKTGSVDPDKEFSMSWEIDANRNSIINKIASEVKRADRLILATDPDREGEAISWHVREVLQSKKALTNQKVQRVVFNAITKNAVLEAMEQPRELNQPLIDAYLARRILDYLVGFTLSPVLWRKLPGARSAGRVQSVALRLICDRENEIESFVPVEYWSMQANLATHNNVPFQARLIEFDGKKYGLQDIGNVDIAKKIKGFLEHGKYAVVHIEAKDQKRYPSPPFTTSTLQQEASRKLGFSATRTMSVAQSLYEGIDFQGETTGLITYMRTDGVQIAQEAINETRSVIREDFSDEYLPEKPKYYSTKAKNAQEAHEAIRPTSLFRRPNSVRNKLNDEQFSLYDLIWKRTIASQMEPALIGRKTVDIEVQNPDEKNHLAKVRATGSVIKFDGFLSLYQEGKDDEQDEENRRLPDMQVGENLNCKSVETEQHFTLPPHRYNEATIVKKMEELGIGRPSTYASTLQTLRDRDYVKLDKKRLVPVDKGRIVTAFLESYFKKYVEFDFTANLEEQLDSISAGNLNWQGVLKQFWQDFNGTIDSIKDLTVTEVIDVLNELLEPIIFPASEDGTKSKTCPKCQQGELSLKLSKTGAFVGCSQYPDCKFTRQLNSTIENTGADPDGFKELGIDPNSGLVVSLRTGRFGPYVQLGEEKKPKRASIPKEWTPDEIDLERALKLLSLPRELESPHPVTGKPIVAAIGRFGPYLLHDGVYANLDSVEEVLNVGMNRAVDLLAESEKNKQQRFKASEILKTLGEHPDGGKIELRSGRYGPYVKHNKINAPIPKGTEPDSITLEQAIEQINIKAAQPKRARTTRRSTRSKK